MQELYIDRQRCDLSEGTLITLDIKSNIFTQVDKMESNRTYSIDIPKTDRNMRIFGNADIVGGDTRTPYTSHTCTYINDGVRIINEGAAYLLSIGDSIRISVVWGVKDTLQSILSGDVKLTDLKANAVLTYTYLNTPTEYSSEDALKAAGYLYADHYNWELPTDKHRLGDVDILEFADTTFHHPTVPSVRVPWLLGLLTNQYGIGFRFPVAISAIVDRLMLMITGDKVTEKSLGGLDLSGTGVQTLGIYSGNGLPYTITATSLEFTQEDGTAISIGDTVTKFKAVSDTTAYVTVNGVELSASIKLTPNNIEVCLDLMNYPIFVHNMTQGVYKAICKPVLTVGGTVIHNMSELLQYEGRTVAVAFTFTGCVEMVLSASDIIRIYHAYYNKRSGQFFDYPFTWQATGTMGIAVDIPDRMTVGLDYDIMANLPDVKAIDLIKHLAVVTGCFVRAFSEDSKTLEFVPIASVYTNTPKDWSDKLITETTATADSVEYTFGDYAKTNRYKFKENEHLQKNHDGEATILNEQLGKETDIFTSVFSTIDYIGGTRLIGWCPYVELPNDWYDIYTGEKEAPTADADKLCEGHPSATISASHTVLHNGVYYAKLSQQTAFDLQTILDTKYADMYETLSNCKVLTEKMRLSDIDIRDFKEDVPIYLRKYGKTFAVLEIKRTSGMAADVKLMMLTKANR